MAAKVVTFADFSKGEFGTTGATHAPAGSFTGRNVLVYQDGSVGPRSGLLNLAPTGVPTGAVRGFGLSQVYTVWFIVGTHVYVVDSNVIGGATRTMTTALGTTPSAIVPKATSGRYVYITVAGDTSYFLDTATEATGALTGAPAGNSIAQYGDRLMIGDVTGTINRVQFSAAADYNSWPVANYFDIGYPGAALVSLFVTRSRLVIVTADRRWWLMTGVPGFNDALREQVQGPIPFLGIHSAVAVDGTVWFVQPLQEYPSTFTGGQIKKFEHLSLIDGDIGNDWTDSSFPPKLGVAELSEGNDVFFAVGLTAGDFSYQGLLYHNGVWTRHSFDVPISGWADGRHDPYRRVLFSDGGDGSTAAKFYSWSYALERPPTANAYVGPTPNFESLGDGSSTTPVDAHFSLPEWWSKDGSEIQIQAVAVDFKKWDHGFSPDNAFAVTLTPLRRDGGSYATAGGDGTTVTLAPAFSEAPSSASTSGTRDRRRWTVPSAYQFANGFQVGVTGIVGCAIEKIHVFYDGRSAQGI